MLYKPRALLILYSPTENWKKLEGLRITVSHRLNFSTLNSDTYSFGFTAAVMASGALCSAAASAFLVKSVFGWRIVYAVPAPTRARLPRTEVALIAADIVACMCRLVVVSDEVVVGLMWSSLRIDVNACEVDERVLGGLRCSWRW